MTSNTEAVDFIALDNGTLRLKHNPYVFLQKDEHITLTGEDVETYRDCTWLRPFDEVRGQPAPPLMSHAMHYVKKPEFPPAQQAANATMTDGYNRNMAAIIQRETNEDFAEAPQKVGTPQPSQVPIAAPDAGMEPATENTGGQAAQGTGNQEVF